MFVVVVTCCSFHTRRQLEGCLSPRRVIAQQNPVVHGILSAYTLGEVDTFSCLRQNARNAVITTNVTHQVSGKPLSWEAYEAADGRHPIFHTLPGARGTAFFGWQVWMDGGWMDGWVQNKLPYIGLRASWFNSCLRDTGKLFRRLLIRFELLVTGVRDFCL